MKDNPETVEKSAIIPDSDDLFASNDLLEMQGEEKEDPTEELDEEEPEDENILDGDPEEEEPEEEQPEPKKDKLDEMTPEQIKEAYRNLEALKGRQGDELGTLRKKLAELQPVVEKTAYTEDDIPTMPDEALDKTIKNYEAYFATPGKSIDDADNYGIHTIAYNKLLVEQGLRKHSQALTSKAMASDNENVANRYNAKLALSTDDLASVKQYALTKLSDDGKLTESDMDVALHKLFPGKYSKMIADKERERITKAKTTTPRLPGNATPPTKGVVSIDHVKNMDADDLAYWIRNEATEAQIEELRRKKII